MVLYALRLTIVGLNTLAMAPVVVAVALWDERVAYRLCRLWVRINLLACGVRVSVRYLTWLDPAVSYVFMSNHRSQYDILAVVEALRAFQLRWVAKKELTRVPVFGWALRRAGHVIVDRSNQAEAVASLRAAREKMDQGVSIMIFPEGRRAVPGELLPFKKGGFMLARETGFAIVPMFVRGTGELLPRGSWRAAGGRVEVVVGAPIDVADLDRDELMRRVREFMVAEEASVVAGSPTQAEAV